jgi:hypothetical protein
MAKPQQPEIADDGGVVPEDNVPGHHPEHEQDKPSGDAFVQKLHEHAQQVDAEREQQRASDEEQASEPEPTIAGDALRAAASAVRAVRENLPGAGD